MTPPHPRPPLSEPSNDLLAKMMQAEVNEGGPPPAAPCDTPAEVVERIHLKTPDEQASAALELLRMTKEDSLATLTKHLERLRDEIQELRSKGAILQRTALAGWTEVLTTVETRQKAAWEKLAEMSTSSGKPWEDMRDSARNAWQDLEQAVQKARSQF